MVYSDSKDRLARSILGTVLIFTLVLGAFPAGFAQAEEGGSGDGGGSSASSSDGGSSGSDSSGGSDSSSSNPSSGGDSGSANDSGSESGSGSDSSDASASETANGEPADGQPAADAAETENADTGSPVAQSQSASSEESATGDTGTDGANATDGTEGGDGASTTEETSNTEGGENGENGSTTGQNTNGASGNGGSGGMLGAEGDTGSTTAATSTSDGKPAIIETGDAGSTGAVVTEANHSSTTASTTGTAEVDTSNVYTSSSTATATASTGDNEASDPDGAGIFTGDADAFGMLVSLFNIVVTNSQGAILFLQNPLGAALDLSSQISGIFSDEPAATTGTSTPSCNLQSCSDRLGIFNVVTDSIAEIENTLIVRAGSGGNKSVSTGGPAVVTTGDAKAFGSVINFGNLQIIDSRYLVILLNNHGNLSGNIVVPPADFFKKLSGAATVTEGNSAEIDNLNTVDIVNNGTSTADSGTNTAQSTDTSLIETGTAEAGADIQNFANQNSLGGRPICFIVSVGGDWKGKVVGMPDNFNSVKTPFGEVICGAGEGAGRSLQSNFTASTTNYAKILNNVIVEAASGGNFASGTDAYIKSGSAEAFLQILNVVNQNIIGQDWIFALFTISGDWEGNLQFGTQAFWDAINEQVAMAYSSGGAVLGETSKLTIEKTVSKATIAASSTVDYTIKVKNKGGPVYNALLVDTIYDEQGKKIHEQRWGLDTIPKGEEITINYTVFYNASTTPGDYTNEAFISGLDRNKNYKKNYAHQVDSPVATATVEITDAIGGVLSAFVEDAPTCERYINTYMRESMPNDPVEVLKLQKFLSEVEKLDVTQTGVFDPQTTKAVIEFQKKYASDILGPWGALAPTGFVYYTTQKKINELYCNDTKAFDLSPSQLSEISGYKNRFFGVPTIAPKVEEQAPAEEQNDQAPEQLIPETNPIIVPPTDDAATTVERVIGGIKNRLFNLVDLITTGFQVVKTAAASTVEQ